MWPSIFFIVAAVACIGSSSGFAVESKAEGCVADLNSAGFPKPDPLFLRPGVTYEDVLDYEDAFILPGDDDGILRLATGQSVRIACPGSSLALTGKSEGIAVCKGNNQFSIGSSSAVTIDKLACKVSPTNTAVRKDDCSGGATGINLGFQLDTMYPLIYTCFNEDTLETYWSEERVAAELKGYESGENSPSFNQDDFFPNLNVDNEYGYDNQIVAFTKLLGSASLANQYLKDHNNYFLARGHFAPRADFVFGAHTRATYHFVNIAPQWQIFNGGVWENLESSVRTYSISQRKDLVVYTGPWGNLEYPDTKGKLVGIYLANPGTSSQTLKVPKFYWKLILEPSSGRGVVFVGINNPYVAIPYPKDYVLCPDVLKEITWLNVKNSTWLYACHVDDFVNLSETFPQIQVSGLLDD